MSQPKFDKDIELLKIHLLAEEWRSDNQTRIGYYFTLIVAVLAVELTAFIASPNLWNVIPEVANTM